MAFIYADTLAIASSGYWTEQDRTVLTTLAIGVTDASVLSVGVVDKTALTVVVRES
jgi:hypothetical protein